MNQFDVKFLSQKVIHELSDGFEVRPLQSGDYQKGFLDCLSMLTTVGKMEEGDFLDRFHYLKSHNDQYFTLVIEDLKLNRIVACGTIVVERKFVHNNGLVGHIEDIVTHRDYRGFNLGKLVIESLKHIGDLTGCYKIILDCSVKNVPFYQKCGFTQKEVEMALYIDRNDSTNLKSKL